MPKRMREALHLVPGTRVTMDQDGESIIIRPDMTSHGLHKKRGLWVYHASAPITAKEIRNNLESGRDEMEDSVLRKKSAS